MANNRMNNGLVRHRFFGHFRGHGITRRSGNFWRIEMQRLLVFVVLCVIVWGCNSSEKDSHDLFLIKMEEQLLYGELVLRDVRSTGYSASSNRDKVLKPRVDKVNEYRKRIPITEKLRESNVVKHIKSRMNNPDSFRLGSISYKPEYSKDYSGYGYLIATVEYYGTNVFNAIVKQKEKFRITPHGFCMANLSDY